MAYIIAVFSFLSCCIHFAIYKQWRPLCARAWDNRWRRWIAVFGKWHCARSSQHWK